MSDLKYCAGCLSTDTTLYRLNKSEIELYKILAITECGRDLMCIVCITMIRNAKQFSEQCSTIDSLLVRITEDNFITLTMTEIKAIDLKKHKITSKLSHRQIFIIDNSDENINEFKVDTIHPQDDRFIYSFNKKINDTIESFNSKSESPLTHYIDVKNDPLTDNVDIKSEFTDDECNLTNDFQDDNKQNDEQSNESTKVIKSSMNQCIEKVKDDNNTKITVKVNKKIKLRRNRKKNNESLSKNDSEDEFISELKKKQELKPRKAKYEIRRIFTEDYADMVELSPDEQLVQFLKRKESRVYRESLFKCELCIKGFVSSETYDNHMKSVHDPSIGTFVCNICSARSPNKNKLRGHILRTHRRIFKCRKCDHISYVVGQARKHELFHQGRSFQCDICGKIFKQPETYYTHLRLMHAHSTVCIACGEPFLSPIGLKMHIRKMHRNENMECDDQRYHCELCNITFLNVLAYQKHTIKSPNHTTYHCDQCSESFATVRAYNTHMRVKHKVKRKVYTSRHIRRPVDKTNDTDVIPMQCPMCPKVLKNMTIYKAHHRTVHLGIKYNKPRHKCDLCDKMFQSPSGAEIHKRSVHLNERPYKCDTCEKSFKTAAAIYVHTRVHTGVKPHQCVHCGKSFSQSNSLKMHIHTVHMKLPTPYKRKERKKQIDSVQGHVVSTTSTS